MNTPTHLNPVRAILVLLVLTASIFAQPPATDTPQADPPVTDTPVTDTPQTVTAEEIQQQITELEAASDIDDATKAQALELYTQAIDALARADESQKQTEQARRDAADSTTLLAQIREELSKAGTPNVPDAPQDATVAQLEQGQSIAAAALNTARDRVDSLTAEATRRRDRRAAIPDELAQARQQLQETDTTLKTRPPSETPSSLDTARRTLLLAQHRALSSRIATIEAELANYDARRDLLPARRDRAIRRVTEAEALVAAWQSLVTNARTKQAADAAAAAEAMRDAARNHPILLEFAAENKALAERRAAPDGILARTSKAERATADTRTRFGQIQRQYVEITRRIEASGLNRAAGRQLRRYYNGLPAIADTAELRRTLAQTERQMERAEYDLVDLQDQRRSVGDIEDVKRRLTEEALRRRLAEGSGISRPTVNAADFEKIAEDLANARRELLDQLITDLTKYTEQTLFELEIATSGLLDAATTYRDFMREKILWVRSIAADEKPSPADVVGSVRTLTDLADWSKAGNKLIEQALEHWIRTSLLIALWILLVAAQPICKRRIRRRAEYAKRYSTDSIVNSIAVLALTIIRSIPYPGLFLLVGWALTQSADQGSAGHAVGAGLLHAGSVILPFVLLRRVFDRHGLAVAHFEWSEVAIQHVRVRLNWFIPVVTPMVVIVGACSALGDEGADATLGRIAFSGVAIVLAIFIIRVLNPNGPALRDFLAKNPTGVVARLRMLWYPAFVAFPIILMITAWLGYYYTAREMGSRYEQTQTMLIVLILVYSILIRWLSLVRRGAAVSEARRRRQVAIEQAKTDAGDLPSESSVPPVDEDTVNFPAVSAQTRQLFRVAIVVAALIGFYGIWADVLPALRMLDRVEIWPQQRIVESDDDIFIPILEPGRAAAEAPAANADAPTLAGESTAGNNVIANPVLMTAPVTSGAADSEATAVTLAQVGLSCLLLLATFIVFRNLPGLVEIVVLQRLPLDAGSRYALATVLRYAIVIIGVAIALSAVQIPWTKIQWLAAALTFGLAFGLQEIFANFICGLIILAERPIRIGDTVTVGTVSGTVTRIRMRATTITEWDRKELVIPNKNFIIGDVINWTLSDSILRTTISVGVGYGEDVRLAEKLLVEAAKAQSLVLTDPKPYVVFNAFGDSTLDFQLRVFIPHIDHLLTVRHDLHMRIIEKFREANVEIAFPQRDLHVRSIGDLKDLVAKPGDLPDIKRTTS